MGCCVSSYATKQHLISKSPPPSSMDDLHETVKEVLSETPSHKPITPKLQLNRLSVAAAHARQLFDKMPNPNSAPIRQRQEISEAVSEICSLSESAISSAADRDRQDRDDDGVSSLRIHHSSAKLRQTRSFSGDLGPKRERVLAGKSPTRKLPDPSPTRTNGGAGLERTGPGRAVRRVGLGSEEQRADRSGRRSQSPVVRSEGRPSRSNNMGRVSPAKKSNQYPGRVRAAPLRSGGNMKESLENPTVSLECFIFI